MKVFSLAAGAMLAATLALPAWADTDSPDSLSYNDPGMHFQAPDGWQRIDLPADAADSDKAPKAIFMYDQGRPDQRSIVITITSDADSLDAFVQNHENDLRQQGSDADQSSDQPDQDSSSGLHVDSSTKVTLSNGMPAYLLKITTGEGLRSLQRYEYLVYDGTRDIDVAYVGRLGTFDEKDALAALASLYVVAYPHDQP